MQSLIVRWTPAQLGDVSFAASPEASPRHVNCSIFWLLQMEQVVVELGCWSLVSVAGADQVDELLQVFVMVVHLCWSLFAGVTALEADWSLQVEEILELGCWSSLPGRAT
jgi:hypothetical protein